MELTCQGLNSLTTTVYGDFFEAFLRVQTIGELAMKIELASIQFGAKIRDVDPTEVSWLREELQEKKEFSEPVRVFEDEYKRRYLTHGFHRATAAKDEGKTHIEAEVIQGTIDDAIDDTCRPHNAEHGKRETLREKRDRVNKYMKLHADKSVRDVAEWCGVSKSAVDRYRKGMTRPEKSPVPCGTPETAPITVGRDGKTYPKTQTAPTLAAVAPPKVANVAPTPKEKKPAIYVMLPDWLAMDVVTKINSLFEEPSGVFNDPSSDMIGWAAWSWNPITGCRTGCNYCYAREIANHRYSKTHGFEPTFHPTRIGQPTIMEVPAEVTEDPTLKNVFTGSMSDIFGEWVPKEWIDPILREVKRANDWNFLFLTKNPKRLLDFEFPDNAWIGATVDCQARVKPTEDVFRQLKAKVKFVSVEPMLEYIQFSDPSIFNWVIIGGASKTNKTPAFTPDYDWVTDLTNRCLKTGVKVFHKINAGTMRFEEVPN